MSEPELYNEYDRRAIHDFFAPDTAYTPQAGTWGLHGIISIPGQAGDCVLIVTYGKREGEHPFDEGISTEGVLRWQSQPKQKLSDSRVQNLIQHNHTLNSVYLFLRTSERANGSVAPYTYLGPLEYVSHNPLREEPVHVSWKLLNWPIPPSVLRRMRLRLETGEALSPEAADEGLFDPNDIEDGRQTLMRSIRVRRGQRIFRNALLSAYDGKCAVTGCAVADILEAAHIIPYAGPSTNHPQNGLLLRSDLHTLFDCGLIAIDPSTMTVVISPKLASSSYRALAGRKLRRPSEGFAPSKEALLLHRHSSNL